MCRRHISGIDADPAQYARHHAARLLDERHQQVLGVDLRMIQLLRQLRRGDDGFLGLFGELI